MNIVALLVAAVAVLFALVACVTVPLMVSQAFRASRAGDAREEKAIVRSLFGLIGLTLWIGLAGFWAVTKPATYDVAHSAGLSRRGARQLRFGGLFVGRGPRLPGLYTPPPHLRKRNGKRRSDAAVARALQGTGGRDGQE
jgi:hypothetical protein